jgi:hypothetical protein
MDEQCRQEISKLSDPRLVQRAFDELYGPYWSEVQSIALRYAQKHELEDARDVLDWNPIKKRFRTGKVAEARGRLRGFLFERICSR